MKTKEGISGYTYTSDRHSGSHDILLSPLDKEIDNFFSYSNKDKRLFEIGCGNGSVANFLSKKGYEIKGIDPSSDGISIANKSYPELDLYQASAYDDLRKRFGQFPFVYSLEVIEHVYAPRDYMKTLFDLVEGGGRIVISTPYHGYWKNLILSLTGKMDAHFTVLWDHGHIKFWSIKTLKQVLEEAGFVNVRFLRVGRIPVLAKSMIAIADKE